MLSGFDVDLQEAPGPPCQRGELVRLPGRKKFVDDAFDVLAFSLIAVAFLAVAVDERFGEGQADDGTGATTCGERWIRSGQRCIVDENAGFCVGWDREGLLREAGGRPDSGGANEFAGWNQFHLHRREWIGDELPGVRRI